MRVHRALMLVALSLLAVTSWVQAQQNGEPRATVPSVVKVDYDTAAFMAPLPLTETQIKGRMRFAQRCANCHGGNNQQLGPSVGRETVDRLGDAAIRDKVRKGSMLMPGFGYTLEPVEIDQIVAFLKTYTPPRRQQDAPAPSSEG